MNSVHNF